MEGIYSITFNNRYFQYCEGWYTASFYNKAGRHQKILRVLASHHLNNSRDNPLATEKAQHKPSGQEKYFEGANLMGCWAAWYQGHPSGWHTMVWWEPPLPWHSWNTAQGHEAHGWRASAPCNYLNTLLSPSENFKIHRYDIFHQCQETPTSMTTQGSQLLRE